MVKKRFILGWVAFLAIAAGNFAFSSTGAVPEGFAVLGDMWPDTDQNLPEGWEEAEVVEKKVLPEMTPEDNKHGYILFAKHYMEDVTPRTIPLGYEKDPSLKIFASLGEYEPVTFSLYAIRDLDGVNVLATDLMDEKGNKIGKENIDIRSLRCFKIETGNKQYKIIPHTLERKNGLKIKQNETQTFWVTLRIPEQAIGGRYQGKVLIETSGETTRELSLAVSVLPFRLEAPEKAYGTFFPGRFHRMLYVPEICANNNRYSPEDLEKIFINYREHGLNSISLCEVAPILEYKDGKVIVNLSEVEPIITAYQKAGLNYPITMDVRSVGWWSDRVGREIKAHQEKKEDGPLNLNFASFVGPNWTQSYQFTAEGDKVYQDIIREILRQAEEKHWPPLFFFPEEEAVNGGIKLIGMKHYMKVLRQVQGVKIIQVECGLQVARDFEEFADIREYNFSNEEEVSRAKKAGVVFRIYNHGWGRLTFGFYVTKLGAAGITQWADQWPFPKPMHNPPYNPYDGLDGMWFFAYPSKNGPIPTVWSETTREGIDDAKYVHTLNLLIEKAEKAESQEAREAGKNAQIEMEKILDNFQGSKGLLGTMRIAIAPSSYDIFRWKIAQHILRLQNLLR